VGVEHLDGTQFVQDLPHRETRRPYSQLLFERDMHTVGDEGDEDTCLDRGFQLMIDCRRARSLFSSLNAASTSVSCRWNSHSCAGDVLPKTLVYCLEQGLEPFRALLRNHGGRVGGHLLEQQARRSSLVKLKA